MPQWEILTPDASVRVLKLSGRWGVEKAEELHRAFLQAMEGTVPLEVDLEEVEDGDLTFFQIISAAHKTAAKGRLKFVKIPEHMSTKAENTGFAPKHTPGIFGQGAE